jgi:hypothetical protein
MSDYPRSGDSERGREPGGEQPFDRFEDSPADTWGADDAATDRRLRALIGSVDPLHAPSYGFERVALRARRRRHRTAFMAAAAGVVAVAVVAGGVIAGTRLTNRSIETAGCETVGQGQALSQIAPAAWSEPDSAGRTYRAADIADGVDSGTGSGGGRGVMERKYEWAIGGVLTAAALSAGIIAGCSTGNGSKGPSANATESGGPSPTQQNQSTMLAPSTTSTTDSAAPSPSASGYPLCVATDLSPAVNVVAGSQAAGHESINIRLTNNSGHTCTVYGFPGLQLQDRNSAGQATNAVRVFTVKPTTLVVKDGGSVATTARFDFDVPASDEPQTGDCEAASMYLGIIPPEEKRQLSAMIMGGPITVCQHGTLNVLPFVAGTTGANQ